MSINSKWQITKIGLVDFWYYDEEEFDFEDGRMLLRGANGSGKSVTMQSFIPLLLDGNMRPERLDPFGSKARRMENYLLEENDGREERTGYLYMEFKREQSETYIAIGIGMRARRSKPMDTWYFFLQDGRRIGKNFFLYRQEKERVPLTKIELRNRIGEGGQVIDSQKEYMSRVNKLIFGFETDDAYKELIDLLIQLRTPKLSKDFKPSIINDILSNSLMPLSEDDLRPMSEAIENMDDLKASLDALKETMAASNKIGRIYNKYNRFILLQKAAEYQKQSKLTKKEENKIKALEETIETNKQQHTSMGQKIEALTIEQQVREAEKASLGDSDAVKLQEREQELTRDLADIKGEEKAKQTNLEKKKEQRIEEEYRQKESSDQKEQYVDELKQSLEALGEIFTQLEFDEYEFMKQELEKLEEETYSFATHRSMLGKVKKHVEDGISKLYQEQSIRERYDELLEAVERKQKERETKEREIRQNENQLRDVKNELLEAVNLWNQESEELSMPEHEMQTILSAIELFTAESDYESVKTKVRLIYEDRQSLALEKKNEISHEFKLKNEEIREKEQQLYQWEQMEDPSPDLPEAVIKNRASLKAAGIDFIEFYKVIDFPEGMAEKQKNRLEEALLSMGILNALIIDSADFAKIKKIDEGTCDQYIFSDVARVRNNLLELLEIVNEDNDIIFYQRMANVLGAMVYGEAQGQSEAGRSTILYPDGHYQLGVLTGTITKQYQAKYIGVKAREDFRQNMIGQLKQELQALLSQKMEIEGRLAEVLEQMERLKKQLEAFPNGADLKTAIDILEKLRTELSGIEGVLRREQESLGQQQKKLSEIRLQIQEISGKVYLPAKLKVFADTRGEIDDYQKELGNLEVIHTRYLNSLVNVRQSLERLDMIDGDLDVLYGEIRTVENRRRRIEEQLASIHEQLKLTDIDQIKEKLNHCLLRLKQLPEEKEACLVQRTILEGELRKAEQDWQETVEKVLMLRKKCAVFQNAVLWEAKLGYVSEEFAALADKDQGAAETISEQIIRQEAASLETVDRESVTGDLQRVYHENRAYLAEYTPQLNNICSEELGEAMDGFRFSRLDVQIKYRSVSMSFHEFMTHIRRDMEEKSGLLSDKERELFEDILLGVINRKIRAKIYSSEAWVKNMNMLMGDMKTSSGIQLSLRWKSKHAEHEGQLDTQKLVELLKKDQNWMNEEESDQLLSHFRSKIQEAREVLEQESGVKSFHAIVRDILDYRQWFEFRLEYQKSGERKKELTDRDFFTFSGGEKAMSMYVPLFSAVVAKYNAADEAAPRLISLDEAFAGVDATNINDMFRLMVDFRFSFIINSQILWGDYESVPSLAIYQLLRADNAKFVTVIPYTWNGKVRQLKQ